ncbi:MAG: TadA family conjugal transfer-associated ATPase [Actinomycetes bacterium]
MNRTPAPDPRLVALLRDRIIADGRDPTPSVVAEVLRRDGLVIGDAAVLALVAGLRAELVGLGPLQQLLDDPLVTDVLVNGPEDVWIDRGAGLERAGIGFDSEASVRRLAQRLATSAGRRLDDAAPFVDAGLVGGLRLHAVLPPIAPAGTVISIRTFRRRAFTLSELIALGTLPAAAEIWLAGIVRQRLAFLVTGGTGCGKTTFLSTLLSLVDPGERILLVEDSGELAPVHPHVVRLVARLPNVEGGGTVSLRDLVRQALRMRPDRIVIGEVRGAEVVDLLAALNTGHEGGAATLHANSAADVPARIAALALAAGLDRGAAHAQLAVGIDVVVQLRRGISGRVLDSINVLVAHDHGTESAVALRSTGSELLPGPGFELLVARLGGIPELQ